MAFLADAVNSSLWCHSLRAATTTIRYFPCRLCLLAFYVKRLGSFLPAVHSIHPKHDYSRICQRSPAWYLYWYRLTWTLSHKCCTNSTLSFGHFLHVVFVSSSTMLRDIITAIFLILTIPSALSEELVRDLNLLC